MKRLLQKNHTQKECRAHRNLCLKSLFLSIFVCASAASFVLSSLSSAQTITIEVTTQEDQLDVPGPFENNPENGCSLREAIETANAMMGLEGAIEIPACAPSLDDAVILPQPARIQILLTQAGSYFIGEDFTEEDEEAGNLRGDFFLDARLDLTIEKSPRAAGDIILDANQKDRLFNIQGSQDTKVTFRNLTFQNGRPFPHDVNSNSGGAFEVNGPIALHIERCRFIDNQTSPFQLEDGTLSTGVGGAIHSSLTSIFIDESQFIGNRVLTSDDLPEGNVVVGGNGGALYTKDATLFTLHKSSLIENSANGTAAVHIRYTQGSAPEEPVSIQDCQFIRNTSSFELIRLRQAAIIERNLFFANEPRDTVLEIGSLAADDTKSKVEANTFVANRTRSIILPFSNERELPVRFNTFFQNEGTIIKKQQNAPISLAANLITGFDDASFEVCRWSGAEPEGEIIVSGGHNVLLMNNYNCGAAHENDILLDDNTEEAWRDIIHIPDTSDLEWNGTIELTDESIAKDAIPTDDPLCENAGLDQLGHLRPEIEESFCDIGALEMDSNPPPNPEQGLGGSGGMENLAGFGGDFSAGGTGGNPFAEPSPLGGEFIQGGEGEMGGDANPPGPTAGEQSAGSQSEGGQNTGGNEEENLGGVQTFGGQIMNEPSAGEQNEPPQGGSDTPDPDMPSNHSSKSKAGCQCSVNSMTLTSVPHHFWLWLTVGLIWFRSRKKHHYT